MTTTKSPCKKTFKNGLYKILELHHSGEPYEQARAITRLLIENGVLDIEGNVYSPTKTALLELLKWHAGGGAVTAVPLHKLALELACSVRTVRCLLQDLEGEGLIRRHHRYAPGNLYTTEILGPSPEPVKGNPDSHVSAATETSEEGLCLKCRRKRVMRNPIPGHLNGVRGERAYVEGVCPECGSRMRSFVKSGVSFNGPPPDEPLDKESRFMSFLKWQRELRQQEQERLDELIGSFGG